MPWAVVRLWVEAEDGFGFLCVRNPKGLAAFKHFVFCNEVRLARKGLQKGGGAGRGGREPPWDVDR